jgi:hypothetical protein
MEQEKRAILWEQACKPGSVPGTPHPMRNHQAAAIYLERPLPDASSSLPGDSAGRLISPYVALHRAGFAQVAGCPAPRALLPHDCTLAGLAPSPCPLPLTGEREMRRYQACGMFLWHFPSGRPDWVLPSALPCGARTFLWEAELHIPAVARPAPILDGSMQGPVIQRRLR